MSLDVEVLRKHPIVQPSAQGRFSQLEVVKTYQLVPKATAHKTFDAQEFWETKSAFAALFVLGPVGLGILAMVINAPFLGFIAGAKALFGIVCLSSDYVYAKSRYPKVAKAPQYNTTHELTENTDLAEEVARIVAQTKTDKVWAHYNQKVQEGKEEWRLLPDPSKTTGDLLWRISNDLGYTDTWRTHNAVEVLSEHMSTGERVYIFRIFDGQIAIVKQKSIPDYQMWLEKFRSSLVVG